MQTTSLMELAVGIQNHSDTFITLGSSQVIRSQVLAQTGQVVTQQLF